MNRYLVFAGLNYYPRGGMEDFVADADTEEAARAYEFAALERLRKEQYSNDLWSQVWDSQEREFLKSAVEEEAE